MAMLAARAVGAPLLSRSGHHVIEAGDSALRCAPTARPADQDVVDAAGDELRKKLIGSETVGPTELPGVLAVGPSRVAVLW
jgi:hypothetical protein